MPDYYVLPATAKIVTATTAEEAARVAAARTGLDNGDLVVVPAVDAVAMQVRRGNAPITVTRTA